MKPILYWLWRRMAGWHRAAAVDRPAADHLASTRYSDYRTRLCSIVVDRFCWSYWSSWSAGSAADADSAPGEPGWPPLATADRVSGSSGDSRRSFLIEFQCIDSCCSWCCLNCSSAADDESVQSAAEAFFSRWKRFEKCSISVLKGAQKIGGPKDRLQSRERVECRRSVIASQRSNSVWSGQD